jgi:hypothetical protein
VWWDTFCGKNIGRTLKMATVTVDIDVWEVMDVWEVLGELTDDEICKAAADRGFSVSKDDIADSLTSDDLDILLQMLIDETGWEKRRVYDKLLNARFG